MNLRERKAIPSAVGKALLGASKAQWNALIAKHVIDVAIVRTGRGDEQRVDFASLERAARALGR